MLTENRNIFYQKGGELTLKLGMEKVYAGSIVCFNSEGLIVPAKDHVGYTFAGISLEESTSLGSVIRVIRRGVFELNAKDLLENYVGKSVYILDEQTFRLHREISRKDSVSQYYPSIFPHSNPYINNIRIGQLVKYISPTKGWVDIRC